MTVIDPCRCPLCSLPNECGVAGGKGTCWCFSQPVPQRIIEQIPARSATSTGHHNGTLAAVVIAAERTNFDALLASIVEPDSC